MLKKFLDDFLKEIPIVRQDRNYWFVRTHGGEYYNSFIEDKVVCIGFNEINLSEIMRLKGGNDLSVIRGISGLVKKKYPNHGMPGLAASQLKKFFFDMKKGDFVIIPGIKTKEFAFGEILDDFPTTHSFENKSSRNNLDWSKSRSVAWHKKVPRHLLNPNLFSLFLTHQAISSGNDYSEYIDSAYFPIYKKGDKYHFQLEINSDSGIIANDLFKLCTELLEGTDDTLSSLAIKQDTSCVEAKINLNSPGVISFIGTAGYSIALICAISVALAGGKFKGKFKGISIDLKSDGIIKRISEYKQDRNHDKLKSDILGLMGTSNQTKPVKKQNPPEE